MLFLLVRTTSGRAPLHSHHLPRSVKMEKRFDDSSALVSPVVARTQKVQPYREQQPVRNQIKDDFQHTPAVRSNDICLNRLRSFPSTVYRYTSPIMSHLVKQLLDLQCQSDAKLVQFTADPYVCLSDRYE